MADKKISQLTAVTMPLAETEVLPIVQSGTTKKVTVAELTTLIKHTMTMDSTNALQFGDAGFTASIAYNGDGSLRIKPRSGYPLQVDLANVKFSNSGYGIDFSANANAPGMTKEVLTWYEEGTWTPATFTNWSTPPSSIISAKYTRIGRLVVLNVLGYQGVISGSGIITGLPFTVDGTGGSVVIQEVSGAGITSFGVVQDSSTRISGLTAANFTGKYWSFSCSYVV